MPESAELPKMKMWIRVVTTCIFTAAILPAQSVTITVPAANQTLSGFSGFSFAASVSGTPNPTTVCYTVDGYPVPGPGPSCSKTPPYAVPWDTVWDLNGPHQVLATAYNAAGSALATSSSVSFTTANNWPCPWNPAMTISTGTSLTSSWSGNVSVSGTISGSSVGTDQFNWTWYIDGVQAGQIANSTSATNSATLHTTQFLDGSHIIGLTVVDTSSSCTTYSDGYEGAATEWTATVTFANTTAGAEIRTNAHEIFLPATNTFTLRPTAYQANGTAMGTQPTFYYRSQNTSVATVSASSGTSSTITAVANGNAQVLTMGGIVSGSDLTCYAGSYPNDLVTSASHPFTQQDVGNLIEVTGGSGFATGLYQIAGVGTGNNLATLSANACNSSPGTGGTFLTGPTRVTWVFVSPSPTILPHFGTNGAILTSYNPAKSFWWAEGFNSGNAYNTAMGAADFAYNTPNTAGINSLLGFGDDIANSGFNVMEFGLTNTGYPGLDLSTSPSQSTFQSAYSSYISSWTNAFAPWPKVRFFGTGDNLTISAQVYYATHGSVASQTPPAVTYMFQTMKNAGNFVGMNWHDEVSDPYGCCPLQGPLKFVSSPTSQSGLTSIVSNGSTCTVNMNPWSFSSSQFAIDRATTSGFNSASGTTYTATNVNSGQFTFPCSVASGTYNSSTDPNLNIEPFANYGWTGSSLTVTYDAFAILRNFQTAVSGYAPAAGTPKAAVGNLPAANWCGSNTQSLEGATNIVDWCDEYWTHGSSENYLPSRISSFSFISDASSQEEAYTTRSLYGVHNPAVPLTIITQGTSTFWGFEGYTVPVASCTNDVCTFSSPHNLSVVIPGVTRLWLASSSNSAYNTNFYVNSILSPTQLSVSLAAEDFSGTASGGTLTFANGYQKTLAGSGNLTTATTNIHLYGDQVYYSGSSDSNIPHERGQTFTISGSSGASSFNSRTFWMSLENLDLPQDGNGNATTYFYFREMPTGSTTGGTATIVADNTFIKGRNGSTDILPGTANHPGASFVSVIEAAVLGGAGDRLYKFGDTTQGWQPHAVILSNGVTVKGGFTGIFSAADAVVFQDNSRQEVGPGQLYSHPHYQNGFAVPMWHAASLANLIIEGNAKYILQPKLNSPDYGFVLDCAARAGSYGDIMFCVNGTEGTQTRTFNLSPYLETGQQIVRYVADPQWITMTVLAAGTASDTVALGPDEAIFYVFPINFAAELEQPTIHAKLADVPNAATVAVRYHYDRYLLDTPATNVFSCGTGTCTLPVNRNIGTVYYRLIYLDASSNVLATSDMQTF
jgi:hypothetical protein